MKLNVNTDAAVVFTNKLEKLHRSALPNAIRGTLNKAAFDVKQNTMPESAAKEFVNRQPNFFKANSRVEMAKGWNMNEMKATVGFVEDRLQGGNNFAVKDLEQQEYGGMIKGRSFIPMRSARGGSDAKPVRPGNRMSKIQRVVNSNEGSGSRQARFNKAVAEAGVGGFVIGNYGKKILWRIDSISTSGGKIKVKKTPVYSYEEKRSVRVDGTGFMREASLKSADKMNQFFIEEAERQIAKLMK